MRITVLLIASAVACALAPGRALAEDYDDLFGYGPLTEPPASGYGWSLTLGGGATRFYDLAMRDATSEAGGLWSVRGAIGTHVPLGLEAGYIGTATTVSALPGASQTLVGSTGEIAMHFSLAPERMFSPFVLVGVGFSRYDVAGSSSGLADAGMGTHDTVFEFPLGAGVAMRSGGFIVDLRGTFRPTTQSDLVRTNDGFATLSTFEASASIGIER
jgi:opacity protein-like surface antigen